MCLQDEAKALVGRSADDMQALKEAGSPEFDDVLNAVKCRPYVFKLRISEDTWQDEQRIRINIVRWGEPLAVLTVKKDLSAMPLLDAHRHSRESELKTARAIPERLHCQPAWLPVHLHFLSQHCWRQVHILSMPLLVVATPCDQFMISQCFQAAYPAEQHKLGGFCSRSGV